MSKAVYVFVRNSDKVAIYTEKLIKFLPKLIPDNIPNCPIEVSSSGNIIFGIVNTRGIHYKTDNSICLGQIFGDTKSWDKPQGSYPDGAFCIFRSDENYVEIVSDVVGSRTIWFYKDDDVFISSNSQRAIVALIGNLKFNENVLPWMLATGTMGPGLSWDKRIEMLGINSSVLLDISKWGIEKKSNALIFEEEKISDEKQEKLLSEELENAFSEIKLDFSKWVLPLSGGVDSRAILFYLKKLKPDFHKLRALTWGIPGAINRKGNDAYVAKELADHLNISHEFHPLKVSDQNVDEIFHRFLICGEGRVDAISGYTDGFYIWQKLFDNNVEGVIRGEQTFGGRMVNSEADARAAVGISFCKDYSNLSNPELNLPTQVLPENMNRKDGESLILWRDRLIIEYRAPILKASLNDLKLQFVEISTPLITRGIVNRILKMNDSQRLTKSLFKSAIKKMSIPVDFATEVAIETPKDIFNSPKIVNLFKEQLVKDETKKVLPEVFYNKLLKSFVAYEQSLGGKPKKLSLKDRIKKMLPLKIKKRFIKLKTDNSVNIIRLAFRVYIVSKMYEMLNEDAAG